MYLKPTDIFFCQSSIKNTFRNGKRIGETLDDLCEGRCLLSNIPTIDVTKKGDKWYTTDNRRLWVFRQLYRLGICGKIPVCTTGLIPSRKMTTTNGGESITVRKGGQGGVWYLKPDGAGAKDLIAEVVRVSCQDVLSMVPNVSCKKVLHVTVAQKRGVKQVYENKTIFNVLVADTSAVLRLHVCDMDLLEMMVVGSGIQICSFITKEGFAEVTELTKVCKAKPIVLPASILEEVKRVLEHEPTKSEAAPLPTSTTVTEKGLVAKATDIDIESTCQTNGELPVKSSLLNMRDVSEATKVGDEIAKTNDDVADVADNIECQDLEVTDCFDSNGKSVPASTNKPASSSDKFHCHYWLRSRDKTILSDEDIVSCPKKQRMDADMPE